MGQVLGIVYHMIATHLIKKAGLTHSTAHTGAVKPNQRFGSALKLNIDFNMLYLNGGTSDLFFLAIGRINKGGHLYIKNAVPFATMLLFD